MDKLLTMAKTFGQELSSADKELKQVKEELKELQDLLNKHKDGTLLKFQEVEIEDLKEENEKLKEELAKVPALLEEERYKERTANERDYEDKEEEEIKDLNNRLMTCKMSIAIRDTEIYELKNRLFNSEKEGNGKVAILQEENEELRLQAFGVNGNNTGEGLILKPPTRKDYIFMLGELKVENKELEEKNKELEERVEELEEHIRSELTKNMETETKPKKKKTIKKKKKKEFDYGESDDWVWGYGYQQKSSEYVIHISGGGDGVSPNGFEDWVIKQVGGELKYYIRHGGNIPDEEQKEGIFPMELWSCPEGNYVSFQLPNYEPREGELSFDWLEGELEEEEETDEEEDE